MPLKRWENVLRVFVGRGGGCSDDSVVEAELGKEALTEDPE